jgi:hypothetical protein
MAVVVPISLAPAIFQTVSRASATPKPKHPSELILESPDGKTLITLRAADNGAFIRLSTPGDKEVSACIQVNGRTGSLELTDSQSTETIAADDLRRAYQALGR